MVGAGDEAASRATADAVVVGGGVIGCSVAYHLSRAGLKVTVYERGELGAQSTGRCAGGVRQQFSSESNVRVQRLSVELLKAFPEEVGFPCEFKQIGYLLLLSTAGQVKSFERQLSMWHRVGVRDARWVTPAEARELVPSLQVDGVLGGTFCPTDGIASPNDVTRGYVAAARRLGACIVEGTEVLSVQVERSRVVGVETTRGATSSPIVIDCAGAWSESLTRPLGINLPVTPYRRHIFVADASPAVSPETPMTVDLATSFYFHPAAGGILFGMGEPEEKPGFDMGVDWGMLDRMEPVVRKRLPPLLDMGIRTGWAGLYEVTPDHNPYIGALPHPSGLWCACGFSGHGFQQAPAVGLVLSQMITGVPVAVDLSDFSPMRDVTVSVAEENFI